MAIGPLTSPLSAHRGDSVHIQGGRAEGAQRVSATGALLRARAPFGARPLIQLRLGSASPRQAFASFSLKGRRDSSFESARAMQSLVLPSTTAAARRFARVIRAALGGAVKMMDGKTKPCREEKNARMA